MHLVRGQRFGFHRLKRAGADVQRDEAEVTPRARICASNSGVKCRPAVGAATEPASRA